MKTRTKKFLGVLLSAACLAGIFTMPALASESTEQEPTEEIASEESESVSQVSSSSAAFTESAQDVPDESVEPENVEPLSESQIPDEPESAEAYEVSSSDAITEEPETSGGDDEIFAEGETAGIHWTLMRSGTVILEDGTVYEAEYPSAETIAKRESEEPSAAPLLKAAPRMRLMAASAMPDEVPNSFSGSGTVTWNDAGSESTYFTLGGLSGVPSAAVNAPDSVSTHCADPTAAAPYVGMVCSYTATLSNWDASTGTATYSVYATPPGATDGFSRNEFGLIGYQHLAGSLSLTFKTNGYLTVKKESADPSVTNGSPDYSLAGAEFRVYEDASCSTPAKTAGGADAVFVTNADGTADTLEMSSGTYYVKETKAPVNFKLNDSVQSVTIESSATVTFTAKDTPIIYGGVKVKKTDAQGQTAQGDAGLAGAEFTISDPAGNVVKTITTDNSGIAATGNRDLVEGSYSIRETKAPAGYQLNSSWKQSFQIKENGKIIDLTGSSCEEPVIRGGIRILKTDAGLHKAQAQGDAALEKATFTITNKSGQRVYADGKWVAAGAVVKTITTNSSGVAQTTSDLLPYGTYEISETSASAGYLVNSSWKQTFQIRENGKIVDLTGSSCEEPVIRGGVKIKKQDSTRKNSQPQGDAALEGAVFTIINKSKAPVIVDGKTIAVGAAAKTIKTNNEGIAQTSADALPYGTYEIAETDPSAGYLLNNGWKQTFTIRENGKIVDLTAKPCDENVIRGGVKIQKTDADLKKAQAQGDATLMKAAFSITNRSKESVFVDGKLYAPGQVVKTLQTDEKGFVQTSADLLPYGTYEITEATPSSGYLLNSSWKQTFQIRENGKIVDLTGSSCEEPVIRGGVKIKKQDTDYKDDAAQGDASLQGAEFTITNKSKAPVVVGGKEYAVDTDVLTISTDAQGIAQTASDALPYGTYQIRETKPSEGYLLNADWKQTFQIRENGKMTDLTEAPCDEDVIRGGVLIEKRDLELDKNEALGGASLAGIEFTVSNASPLRVWVDGESFEPEAVIAKIYTDEEGHASLPETCLPYGTYTIQETKTNASYLLTDGGPRTFVIRNNGETATITEDEEEMIFRDQVVRNDFRFNKIADSSNARMGRTAFVVTMLKTGEQHVIVTDKNGVYNSGSKVNPHSQNTNGNDFVLEKYADDIIPTEDLDYTAGLWFGLGQNGSEAETQDGLGALPYGDYRIQELPCESNIGYKLLNIRFYVETDQTVEAIIDLGTLTDDEEEKPEIRTTAYAGESESHEVQAGEKVTITDTVSYKNLIPGTEYTMHGTLMIVPEDAAEAQPLVAGGKAVTSEMTFAPDSADGTISMTFTFDASALAGTKTVVFEEVRRGGLIIAAHADAEDEDQQVSIIDIGTTAADEETGMHTTQPEKKDVFVDTVRYTGLTPGKKYEVKGILMDADTGEELQINGKTVKAQKDFVPEAADGTVELTFTADTRELTGKTIVVFEDLYRDGKKIAVHADITDKEQSITVIEIGTTALDKVTDTHESEVSETAVFTDTVRYAGLTPGKVYTVKGVLMDADTGKELLINGTAVTSETEFTPEAAEGSVTMEYTLNTSDLAGKKTVVFEDLYTDGNKIAAHADISDENQGIRIVELGTKAIDKATGTQEAEPAEKTVLVDTVEYTGLTKGLTYVVKGVLMDKETGTELLVGGNPVTAEKEFKAKKSDGSIVLEFVFDSSALAGKTVVVFEDLYRDGVKIASHADINDNDQSVTVKTPEPEPTPEVPTPTPETPVPTSTPTPVNPTVTPAPSVTSTPVNPTVTPVPSGGKTDTKALKASPVQTGDNTPIIRYLLMLGFAGAIAVAAAVWKMKRK